MAEIINYGGYSIALADPWKPPLKQFLGRNAEMRKCQAAWKISLDGKTLAMGGSAPLNFRLQGPPGVGKNEIVYQIARLLNKPLYMIQGHEELTPEDLALLLVPDSTAKSNAPGTMSLRLQASPLASAILKGGLFFFDEINRVSERALAPLASVLDDRRSIYSAITGLMIEPLPGNEGLFRFCCALNPILSEAGRTVLPDYIEERTLPSIKIDYLRFEDTLEIIKKNLQPTPEFLGAFQKWHAQKNRQDISVRQAMTLMDYAMSLSSHQNVPPAQALEDADPHVFTNPNLNNWSAPPPPLPKIKIMLPPAENDGYYFLRDFDDIVCGQPYLFRVFGANFGPIWGSGGEDLYTEDTALGTAAVHSGLLKLDQEGVLQVTVFDTSDGRKFQGTDQNGIKSSTWTDGWPRGYRLEKPKAEPAKEPEPSKEAEPAKETVKKPRRPTRGATAPTPK